MVLHVSKSVKNQLREKHHIPVLEVGQCFASRRTGDLSDTGTIHNTDPCTANDLVENNAPPLEYRTVDGIHSEHRLIKCRN